MDKTAVLVAVLRFFGEFFEEDFEFFGEVARFEKFESSNGTDEEHEPEIEYVLSDFGLFGIENLVRIVFVEMFLE
jgi:hypothetical protein